MAYVRLVTPAGSGSSDGDTPVALLGGSDAVRAARAAVEAATAARTPVLVVAEPGCGARAVSEWLHARTRPVEPILTIDCSTAAPADLAQHLFGAPDPREGGADLEPVGDRSALMEAGAGTLVIEHIEELPSSLQRRLARVLRDGEVRSGDGRAALPVTCRVVASAPRDLDDEVREGRFRSDLWRRLSACAIRVPPLRHRAGDLAAIIERLMSELPGAPRTFTQPAVTVLAALPWTRNVDELAAVLRRVAQHAGPVIRQEDILAHLPIDDAFTRFDTTSSLRDARLRFEREYIVAVLERHQWRIPEAAATLGIERANLYRKIRQLGLSRPVAAPGE